MGCSPPGSSVHGISQSNKTGVGCQFLLQGISCISGRFLYFWATREASFQTYGDYNSYAFQDSYQMQNLDLNVVFSFFMCKHYILLILPYCLLSSVECREHLVEKYRFYLTLRQHIWICDFITVSIKIIWKVSILLGYSG